MSENWPIFYKEALIKGNPRSNIAICTLWTKKELFLDLPIEKISVIGNLYTTYGINPMLKNIIANPRIRYIIVCGSDLMKTGEILVNFFNEGINENYKIKGTDAYIDKTIPKEAIETVRKNVKLIDLRSVKSIGELKEEILKILNELYKEEDYFMEPILVSEEEYEVDSLYSEDVAFRIEGNSISEVWLKALDVVLKFGEVKETEYNIKQKEVLDLISVIKKDEEQPPEWLPLSKQQLENYYLSFFSKSKPEGVEYTYGERLFGLKVGNVIPKMRKEAEEILNQVDLAVKKLKEKPYSRRAIAVTWRHEFDISSQSPPCLIEVIWSIKNGKLYQTSTFRSHDIFGAWLLNVFALRKLQKEIAKEISVGLGSLIVVSVSAHIYESDWKRAEEIVKSYYRNRKLEFEEDERGFFVISIKNGEIVVEHRLKDGRKTKYTFRGKNAEELYRKILNENLVSRLDHAAYLGKELARAEICLREGKSYVQDGV